MRAVRFAAPWWLALAAWWVLLVGTNSWLELVAAACAATLGTALAFGIHRRRLLRFSFELRRLARNLIAPWKVVRELGVVMWALALHLARVRPVRSAYRAFFFPAGRSDAVSAGRRAVVTLADGLSPNTLPLDMDCDREVVLRHELDPRRASNDLK
jgi:hypothetical protein